MTFHSGGSLQSIACPQQFPVPTKQNKKKKHEPVFWFLETKTIYRLGDKEDVIQREYWLKPHSEDLIRDISLYDYSQLTTKKYKNRHDKARKVIHWELCKKHIFNLVNLADNLQITFTLSTVFLTDKPR